MRLRPWHVFAIFGASLLFALAGVSWISAHVIALDRAEAKARAQAAVEENVRLALWRMDSALAPIVAAEAARPYFWYAPFHDAERPYDRMVAGFGPASSLVASPLLVELPEHALLHFQYDGRDAPTSPQVPQAGLRSIAIERGVPAERIAEAGQRLERLARAAPRARVAELLEVAEPAGVEVPGGEGQPAPTQEIPEKTAVYSKKSQKKKNSAEWSKRAKSVKLATDNAYIQQRQIASSTGRLYDSSASQDGAEQGDGEAGPPRSDLVPARGAEGAMHPMWVGDLLLLVRRSRAGGRGYIQGCWLDWDRLQAKLLEEVRDLLPEARLEPIGPAAAGEESASRLASLPIRIIPGAIDRSEPAGISAPVVATLAISWAGVLLAAFAAGFLLFGATSLSERRADFVSAVTHELRTPLTTFRMYTEMLADGMIEDEAKRARYVETLRREALRLSHLVENVLSFARLERGRHTASKERLSIGAAIDRFSDRLRDRAAQANMTVELDVAAAAQLEVEADPSAIEHILFNLVDNACKYAASAGDRRIHVAASGSGRHVVVRVSDHGPGVSAADKKRLFSPFSKSAARAASSAPGVGLGLALSRRLARSMGGDLTLEPATSGGGGATFALVLPALGTGHRLT